MKKSYTMYIYYKNTYMCKFYCLSTDPYAIYEIMGKELINQAFLKNINYKKQIETFTKFCDIIYKRKINCHKIRRSDYLMFCSCFLALLKYKCVEFTDILFLKNKIKKTNLKITKKKIKQIIEIDCYGFSS